MENFQVILFLLVVLICLSAIPENDKIPQPIILVLAGLLIGFLPNLPELSIEPEVIFLLFLPPLLFDAASQTSWHEFKADFRPITAMAISLVFFTTGAVAITAHYLMPKFGWPLAFLLGAIISPTDAVASSGIIKKMNLNRRVMTILEGESLMNDASALIAYRYALAAVLTGSFVFWKAGLQFILVAGGGVVIGIMLGYALVLIHKRIHHNTLVESGLSLLTPFIAYLLAEKLHVSGILSVVTAGLVISWKSPEIFTYQTRMRNHVIWDTLVFLLNGFIFILIGMQMPLILRQVVNYSTEKLVGYGILISLVTIVVRILWVLGGAYATKMFHPKKESTNGSDKGKEEVPWKNVFIIAWTGTRGVLSLATALALPLLLRSGKIFPERHLILFLAFVVILATLVLQGLTLPLLIRILKIKPEGNEREEQKKLQLHLVNSTLHFLDRGLSVSIDRHSKKILKNKYNEEADILTRDIRNAKKMQPTDKPISAETASPLLLAQIEIRRFQRDLLIKVHKEGVYSDTAIKGVERDMDIDDLKLDSILPKEAELPVVEDKK